MSARRGHLAAVPGAGRPAADELVRERPRILAPVVICQHPECDEYVQVLPTPDGLVVFDARPVPLTRELVEQGGAYLVWVGESVSMVVNALGLPEGAYADQEVVLTPHLHELPQSG